MEQGYYTAKEVAEVLKRSIRTIYREAQNRELPSVGKRPNIRFPKEAIDTIATIEEAKRKKKNEPELIFSSSTLSDLWQTVNIGRDQPYGDDDTVSYRTLLEWREVNDEIFMSLKSKGEVVGYSTLIPLEEKVIISLIKDEIREKDIPLDAIRQWNDSSISVYIATVAVKPSDKKTRDAERAGIVIKNTIKWALKTDRQSNVKKWYGIGATKEGQNLLEELGFEEIASLHNGERKGYCLEDIKKPVRLAKRLLDRLNQEPSTAL